MWLFDLFFTQLCKIDVMVLIFISISESPLDFEITGVDRSRLYLYLRRGDIRVFKCKQ